MRRIVAPPRGTSIAATWCFVVIGVIAVLGLILMAITVVIVAIANRVPTLGRPAR